MGLLRELAPLVGVLVCESAVFLSGLGALRVIALGLAHCVEGGEEVQREGRERERGGERGEERGICTGTAEEEADVVGCCCCLSRRADRDAGQPRRDRRAAATGADTSIGMYSLSEPVNICKSPPPPP